MEEMGRGYVTHDPEFYGAMARSGEGLLVNDPSASGLAAVGAGGPGSAESGLSRSQSFGLSPSTSLSGHGAQMLLPGFGFGPPPDPPPHRTSSSAGHGASSHSHSHSHGQSDRRISVRSSSSGAGAGAAFIPSGLVSSESEGGASSGPGMGLARSADGHIVRPPSLATPGRARAQTFGGSDLPPPSSFFDAPANSGAPPERQRSGKAFLRRSLKWRLRGGGVASSGSGSGSGSGGEGGSGPSGSGGVATIPMTTFFGGGQGGNGGRPPPRPVIIPPFLSLPSGDGGGEMHPVVGVHDDSEADIEDADGAPVGLLHPRLGLNAAGRSAGTLSLRDDVDYSRPLAVVRIFLATSYIGFILPVSHFTDVFFFLNRGCTVRRQSTQVRARRRSANRLSV
ncbi:hypothetical protein BV25DRAFT_161314 [Artomyces pyxidatus]|uniref:Uncharacterized protein n=1 Tax=Artomyces pyxidatus TaxID=48021 RepID=A0ACB8TA37_9AGAM|nr:hypothetical protein BV25DRAFT_161314 [Artomyces pyxidatus]